LRVVPAADDAPPATLRVTVPALTALWVRGLSAAAGS